MSSCMTVGEALSPAETQFHQMQHETKMVHAWWDNLIECGKDSKKPVGNYQNLGKAS